MTLLQFVLGVVILGLGYAWLTIDKPHPGVEVFSIKRKGWEVLLPAQFIWIKHGRAVLAEGLKTCRSCFQVQTGSGYKIVVPNRFTDEVKNHPSLDVHPAFAKEIFVDYPGFDGARVIGKGGRFLDDVCRVKLSQSLGLITEDLVDESNESFHDMIGDPESWQTRRIKEDVLDIIARVSSRVFLGKTLCREKEWLDIAKDYAVNIFAGAGFLRMCPAPLRPLLYWTIPACARLRRGVRHARQLIEPQVERRRAQAEIAIKSGEKIAKNTDAIGWMVEMSSNQPRDYVAGQLALSMAAIHTSTDAISRCILQLCESPAVVPALQEEMVRVLREEGWSRLALHNMKLLDSFLKEVQRTSPVTLVNMHRMVTQQMTLSDGTVLPVGSRIMVSDDRLRDPSIYTDPDKFDAARFARLREQSGEENRHQYVSLSPNLLAFGHGEYSCPGRFFASNEIKIVLIFLLLRYDIRYVPDQLRPKVKIIEAISGVPRDIEVQVRRRREEIDLVDLKGSR